MILLAEMDDALAGHSDAAANDDSEVPTTPVADKAPAADTKDTPPEPEPTPTWPQSGFGSFSN